MPSTEHFKGQVKAKDTERKAPWACVVIGNVLRLSEEVSELSACHFSIQKLNHCSMAVRVIEATLCAHATVCSRRLNYQECSPVRFLVLSGGDL